MRTMTHTQIQRLGRHAMARHLNIDARTPGQYDISQGGTIISVAYSPSNGDIHDAFVRVVDDNGDAVQRWSIVRADDDNKLAKVIEYLNSIS